MDLYYTIIITNYIQNSNTDKVLTFDFEKERQMKGTYHLPMMHF